MSDKTYPHCAGVQKKKLILRGELYPHIYIYLNFYANKILEFHCAGLEDYPVSQRPLK